MKIELKEYQTAAAQRLYRYVQSAKRDIDDGDPQAIVLSSPTGSGKTVTITALMEWIYGGFESHPPDRTAVFLWLSDSPELNMQSRDKMLRQSTVFREHQLITLEPPFSQEFFEAGNVYFLNTQKLGAGSLLTKLGDGRDYTIWDTIQNTAATKPASFYLIIDEAHRGMNEKPRERLRAQSIVQRFIKGYPEEGLQPIPLIIGMSATPERFNELIAGTPRTKRELSINPDDVKASGLMKDKIVLYCREANLPTDWSLLQAAAGRWRKFCIEWQNYEIAQGLEHPVLPVMVIQVEDGGDKVLTHTDLEVLVSVVERETGRLADDAWVHSFQEDKTIEVGGRKIRKVDASRIDEDPAARIVLFKMSLTTGWDCPRAEVMMSFRRAEDFTHIAQLVGRMVRTPLARSIEGQDFLNTVSLYLPNFDRLGLRTILEKLGNPDPDTGLAILAEDGHRLITLQRAPQLNDAFESLAAIPTYHLEQTDKTSETRRLMRLARRLTLLDGLDGSAYSDARKLIVSILQSELTRLRKDPRFIGNQSSQREIEVREVWVEYGEWKELDTAKTFRLKTSPENIDDLFDYCGRMLGEGLHMDYWKAQSSDDNPSGAKLELFGVLQDKTAWQKLERLSKTRTDELLSRNRAAIQALPTGVQELYWRIKRTTRKPEPEPMTVFKTIESRSEQTRWPKHLFAESDGTYGAELNQWEVAVLQAELSRPDVIGWLRNVPRQQWALCVPYEMGNEYKSLYPDFLVFRHLDGGVVVDILDPHTTALADAQFKAHGLAEYAEKHGDRFGRIELITMTPSGALRRLDLQTPSIRESVVSAKDKPDLDRVFEEYG